jgi:hypothetical protein
LTTALAKGAPGCLKAAIPPVVRTMAPRFRECYMALLQRAKSWPPVVRARLRFVIEAGGRVRRASAALIDTSREPDFEACLAKLVEGARFEMAAPPAGICMVDYPLVFKATPAP